MRMGAGWRGGRGLNRRFDCCVSLGWFCGTASSMGKCGLRSHAGPFDWYLSDFEPVLKMIETDFSDFMKKENLVVDNTDHTVFLDVKYGFRCNHDIHDDFETEYPSIYQKYMRRAARFLCDTEQPTCFIRAVRSVEELQFIEGNEDYILRTIKKRNPENEIVFLLLKDMKGLSENCIFPWFRLGIENYIGFSYEMRMMFESSKLLSEFCARDILSEEVKERNKKFDRDHLHISDKIGIFIERINRRECNIDQVLKAYWKDFEQGIYLWGAGECGKTILRYVLSQGIEVKGVIDNNPDKIGTLFENVPVDGFSIITENDACIWITIGSPSMEKKVKEQISERISSSNIVGMTDLVMHPLIVELL